MCDKQYADCLDWYLFYVVCVGLYFFLLSCIIVCYFYSCLWHVSDTALCLICQIDWVECNRRMTLVSSVRCSLREKLIRRPEGCLFDKHKSNTADALTCCLWRLFSLCALSCLLCSPSERSSACSRQCWHIRSFGRPTGALIVLLTRPMNYRRNCSCTAYGRRSVVILFCTLNFASGFMRVCLFHLSVVFRF